MQPWGTDWTQDYPSNPLLVVFPKSTEEVSQILKYCYDHKLAVVPSGGRTGLAAGAVASQNEIVLSLDKMNKILNFDPLSMSFEVEAGVITEQVQNYAWEKGFFFPIDLASKGSCQIGGNIATNAGGLKFIRYGGMRHFVLGIEVVLANGDIVDLNKKLHKDNTGYDLKQLFIGSEGTLGVITKATLSLVKQPEQLNLSLVGIKDIDSMVKLITHINQKKLQLSAFEFFTDKAMKLVQANFNDLQTPFLSSKAPYYALIEVESSQLQIKETLENLWMEFFDQDIICDAFLATTSDEFKKAWSLRENITECIAINSYVKKNDITLTTDSITKFISTIDNEIFPKLKNIEVFLFGHLGDGNIHVNYRAPKSINREDFLEELKPLEQRVLSKVIELKGSISAEHGIGLLKKDLLKQACSQNELQLMKNIKAIFDPTGIMNPGKIL